MSREEVQRFQTDEGRAVVQKFMTDALADEAEANETSAGETGRREAMSEARLAEIRHLVYAIDLPGGAYPSLTRELLAELIRLRGVYVELHQTADQDIDRLAQLAAAANDRAEAAERALGEMRGRDGEGPHPFLAAAMVEVTPEMREQFEEEWAKAMADWDGKHVIYKSPIELRDEWSYETLTRTGWRRCTTTMTEEYARKRAADSDRNRLVHRKASDWRVVGEGEATDGA